VELVYRGVYGGRALRDRADRLREAMARAEQSYARALDEKGAAYQYALSRGLKPETIKAWSLGFAPDAWRTLLDELSAAGFKTEELLAAGLIKEADGKPGTYYDRFRNRLMFPIRDAAGRTVAFTGRALDPDDQAKYLNSPETDLYKKGEILFGMDKAKDAIRIRQFALLVEGQMDLLHAHQAGFTNAVALSGTALTPAHLSLMKRYSENLMLALDGDRAGLAATQKHAIAALRAGMRVKAVRLPKGKDPADVITEGPEGAKDFAKRVAEAQPIVEFFLGVLAEGESDPHRLVLAAERVVLPLVAAIQSPIEREHFIGATARALGSTPEAVRASVPRAAALAGADAPRSAAQPSAAPAQAPQSRRERRALELRAVAKNYAGTPLAERVANEYNRIQGSPLMEDDVPERALFEAGLTFGENPAEDAADELIALFERSVLEEARDGALLRLRRAEASKDKGAIEEANRAYADISKKAAALS
jgi:DNA primase